MELRYDELPRKILLGIIRTLETKSSGRDALEFATARNREVISTYAKLISKERDMSKEVENLYSSLQKTMKIVYGDGSRNDISEAEWKALDSSEKEYEKANTKLKRLREEIRGYN